MRSPDERRIDAAILLTLWARCSAQPRQDAGDKLRQMKLAFLAALGLDGEGLLALHLSFYRWTWGPMSNGVYEAWSDLERAELLESEEHFVLSRRGEMLANEFYQEVLGDERNVEIRRILDGVAKAWAPIPDTREILDFVYDMKVTPVGDLDPRTIRQIGKSTDLLHPIDPAVARRTLYVEPGWHETLSLLLVPGAAAPLHASVADYRAGRVHVA